jgi:methylisocitrate lyase
MSRSARFRELLRKPPFVCMGAHDAVTAKLAEQAGAPAIYVSGFVASAIVAGAPDFGVLTQTEMFEHIRRICRVTTVPVFADADTGYGGALDAQRTIQLWEEAGASVLHLEDQAMPKKCGHFAGKQLVSAEEMQQKLRAMLAARRDPDFFVVARTDAMGVTDLDDAIRRLEAYAAVGADGLYVDAPRNVEQDALPKKVLFDLVYSARLMPSAEALSLHVVNEVTDRGTVLERAVERARQAGGHRRGVVTLGRDLYYAMRGLRAEESLEQAERALLAALKLE